MRCSASSSTCDTLVFFFQAEDGIRDYKVTGVQTCALPISLGLEEVVQFGQQGSVQAHGAAAQVFVQVVHAGGARQGNHMLALVQHPGDGQLDRKSVV